MFQPHAALMEFQLTSCLWWVKERRERSISCEITVSEACSGCRWWLAQCGLQYPADAPPVNTRTVTTYFQMSHRAERKTGGLGRSGVAEMKVALSQCSLQESLGSRGEVKGGRRHSVSSSVTSTSSLSSRTSRLSTSTTSSASSRGSGGNIRSRLSKDVLEKIGNRQLKVVNETSSKL